MGSAKAGLLDVLSAQKSVSMWGQKKVGRWDVRKMGAKWDGWYRQVSLEPMSEVGVWASKTAVVMAPEMAES